MIKLKFSVCVYSWSSGKNYKNKYFYESLYSDDVKFGDIINFISNKYNPSTTHSKVVIYGINDLLWGKYFKKVGVLNSFRDLRIQSDYYEYNVGDLCSQFNIDKDVINISINPPYGSDVGRRNGIKFYFHTNEKDLHHKPHIHVQSDDVEFRIDLERIEIMDENVFKNPKKVKYALEVVSYNQKDLLNYWYKVVVNGEKIKFKMFFPC